MTNTKSTRDPWDSEKAKRGINYLAKRDCRNPNCERKRHPTKLVCIECWRLVPKTLRDKVEHLWREKGLSNEYAEAVTDVVESLL